MGATNIKSIFLVGSDVIKSEMKGADNTPEFQIGNLADKEVTYPAEYWGPFGVMSRPSVADPTDSNGAAQVISINHSGYNLIIGARDIRTNNLYGQLKEGETCLYGASQGRILIKQNGSINLYTTEGNEAGATGMGIFINPDDDSISILNSQGAGIVIKGKTVTITSGGAALVLDDQSAKLVSKETTTVDGGTIHLGANPANVPGVNSALCGPTGIAGIASSRVLIGI